MCGIVGIVGHACDDATLRRATAALHHRGPDGAGIYRSADGRVGLGHARLAIVDLVTGAQPIASESGDVVVVVNGELYGFEAQRATLERRGHTFRTQSDSEIVVHLYEEHGADCVTELRGEFALLIHDVRRGRLVAARDRFGIKPLYVHAGGGRHVFASEAKGLFATGLVEPRLDVTALRDTLCFVPPDSIFDEVRVVPPGGVMEVDVARGTSTVRRYWTPDLTPVSGTGAAHEDGSDVARVPGPHEAGAHTADADTADVREAVFDAIRVRLRADVPVGVYLSGGLDSAIVAAAVARMVPGRLQAFTVSFPGAGPFDEASAAREVAAHVGVDCHVVACDEASLVENLEPALVAAEMPFANGQGIAKFMLSALAAHHVPVVLTGEGADEVFLGYHWFQQPAARTTGDLDTLLGASPPGLDRMTRPWVQGLLRRLFHRHHRPRLAATSPVDRLLARVGPQDLQGLPPVRRLQRLFIGSMLPAHILTVLGDRAEMAHGVEGRTPFLDHRLFERARRVPDALKIRDGVGKAVLRDAFADLLPPAARTRRKWPFVAPPIWLRAGRDPRLDILLREHLSVAAIRRAGVFSPVAVAVLRLLLRVLRVLRGEGRAARALNALLLFVLSVQILSARFVGELAAPAGGPPRRTPSSHPCRPSLARRRLPHPRSPAGASRYDEGAVPPLRIAFLGCGFITEVHSRHLRTLRSRIACAYASRDLAKAERFTRRFGGVASYGSYDAAIADPAVDAVVVAVPPLFHLPLTQQALAAGKHVLVEKPAFFTMADYRAAAASRDRAGRVVLVGENDHYKPLAVVLRRLLASGVIGEMVFAQFVTLAKRLKTADDWRNDESMAGGDAFFEEGIHWLHLASSLGPKITSIHGYRPLASREGPDRRAKSMMAAFRYDNHAVGSLYYSREVPSLFRGLRLSKLFGRRGIITFESNGAFVLVRGEGAPRLLFPGVRDIRGYRAMYLDFHRAITQGGMPEMNLERAMEDQVLMDQVYATLDGGAPPAV